MKKTILVLLITAISITVNAQDKKDTTVQTTMTLNEYRALMNTIDQNIDSKTLTKQIMEFFQKRTQIVADKPKEIKKP